MEKSCLSALWKQFWLKFIPPLLNEQYKETTIKKNETAFGLTAAELN